jgi:hypothetical protein
MKAEVFYYGEEQRRPALRIKQLLRAHVYPALSPVMNDITGLTGEASAKMGWRYVKLLQASIPPEKGIQLSIRSTYVLGYSSYIHIYYPFVYSQRDFQIDSRKRFFPALAIHNRMVLVPKGLAQLLDYSKEILTPFYPIEKGGVQEVDFTDELTLTDALVQVGQILRKELFAELRAYATYHSFNKIDFPRLAEELNTEEGFLRHLCGTVATEYPFYKELTCELDQHEIHEGRWSKVNLTIQNNSSILLPDITVDIKGPAEILPSRIRTTISPASTQQVPIALKPKEVGDFPLELVFALPEDEAFADWLPVHHIWVHCE